MPHSWLYPGSRIAPGSWLREHAAGLASRYEYREDDSPGHGHWRLILRIEPAVWHERYTRVYFAHPERGELATDIRGNSTAHIRPAQTGDTGESGG